MISFIWKGIRSFFYSERFVHYTDKVVVLRNRKIELINAKFKKGVDSGYIFIMLESGEWKNVEDIFSKRSIPRIHRKSEKALNSSNQVY